MSDRGHIELERRVDAIVVGERHGHHPGDLTALMESMKRVGLLQPVTITPDGYLICGYRRLEASKQLGWKTLRVWVRSGISDELTRLLAERDENITHLPLAAVVARVRRYLTLPADPVVVPALAVPHPDQSTATAVGTPSAAHHHRTGPCRRSLPVNLRDR